MCCGLAAEIGRLCHFFGSMVEAHPDDWDVAYGDLMPGGPLHFTGAIVYPQPYHNLSNTYMYIHICINICIC